MWWVYSYFSLLNNKADLLFSFLEFLLLHVRFVYLSFVFTYMRYFLLGRIVCRMHKISTLNYMACSSSGKDPGLSSQWSPVRIWYTLPYCGWQVSIWSGLISRRKLEQHQHLARSTERKPPRGVDWVMLISLNVI